MFKKVSRDFCILQYEQVDGSKYVISLRSIKWPGCIENDDIRRATVGNIVTYLLRTIYSVSSYPMHSLLACLRPNWIYSNYKLFSSVACQWLDNRTSPKGQQTVFYGHIYNAGWLLNVIWLSQFSVNIINRHLPLYYNCYALCYFLSCCCYAAATTTSTTTALIIITIIIIFIVVVVVVVTVSAVDVGFVVVTASTSTVTTTAAWCCYC